jgi:hypothetical protein
MVETIRRDLLIIELAKKIGLHNINRYTHNINLIKEASYALASSV